MGCTNPNGCTLDAAEMAERMGAWRELSSRALSRQVEGGRITTVYPKDERLLAELRELVAKEAVCCPFLEFTIEEGTDRTIVRLSFPEEARPLVESILAAPAVMHERTRGRPEVVRDHPDRARRIPR